MAVEEKDANAPVTAVIGLIGTVLLIISVIWLQGLYSKTGNAEMTRKQIMGMYDEVLSLKAEQRAELNDYAWVNRDAGVVEIPIDRAIEVVASRYTGGAPARGE